MIKAERQYGQYNLQSEKIGIQTHVHVYTHNYNCMPLLVNRRKHIKPWMHCGVNLKKYLQVLASSISL